MTTTPLCGSCLAVLALTVVVPTPQAAGRSARLPRLPPHEQRSSQTPPKAAPPAIHRIAVLPFIALSQDEATRAAARTIADVLWDDLAFEAEFSLIPREQSGAIPQTPTPDEREFERWRQLGADGVLIGSVRSRGTTVSVHGALSTSGQASG